MGVGWMTVGCGSATGVGGLCLCCVVGWGYAVRDVKFSLSVLVMRHDRINELLWVYVCVFLFKA